MTTPKASKNVYWRDVKPGEKVEETPTLFTVGEGRTKRVAYWMGQEAKDAQIMLRRWAKKGSR